jgi:hypothetical protein
VDVDQGQLVGRPIAEVRSMPLHEAEQGVAVRIRGVVTFLAREHIPKEAVIVQDATAGMWVSLERLAKLPEGLARGAEIEIDAVTDRGGFAPNLLATAVRMVGTRPLPEAQAVSDERFFSGADTCSRIALTGVLQGYRDDGLQWRLILERGGRHFLVSIPKSLFTGDPATLVDATLQFAGTGYRGQGRAGRTLPAPNGEAAARWGRWPSPPTSPTRPAVEQGAL